MTGIDGSGNPTAGVQVTSGGGSWSSISDRSLKENFEPVDTKKMLKRVAQLPISNWNYKSQDRSIRHIGPMAQDFYAAFNVGEDNRHITTVDADGVALAAIKELAKQNQELRERIEQIEALVKSLLAQQNSSNVPQDEFGMSN